jgi:hypothetical protein
MRRRFIYDHDLDAMVEITPGTNHPDPVPGAGVQIIRDIDPYRTAASDVAHENKRVVIGSRSRHREFLRDNNYVEVGNEKPITDGPRGLTTADRINDIRRAMGHFGSNRGGSRDW